MTQSKRKGCKPPKAPDAPVKTAAKRPKAGILRDPVKIMAELVNKGLKPEGSWPELAELIEYGQYNSSRIGVNLKKHRRRRVNAVGKIALL